MPDQLPDIGSRLKDNSISQQERSGPSNVFLNFLKNFFSKFNKTPFEIKNLVTKKLSASLPPTRTFLQTRKQKIILGICLSLVFLLSIIAVFAVYTYQTAMTIKTQADQAQIIGQEAYDAFKNQNLPATEQKVMALQNKVADIKTTYYSLSFYRYIPIANQYFIDGEHGLKAAEYGLDAALKAVSNITPYADVLGFEGEDTFTGGTAENRIKIILETLDKVMPFFDEIAQDLSQAENELLQIDAQRYPEDLKGRNLRQMITQAQNMVHGSVQALTEFRPILEQLPSIAGGRGERKKYLILFQNDNELRPTGGFLTAYSVIFIEDGKVTPEKSDDIYELDKKFYKKIPIPEELGRYLTTEKYWNLRDMNISPDFKTSMDQFFEHYLTIRGEPDNIDGIIAVDTHILTRLLETLGPVEVPGFGIFSAEIDKRCDCPQVVYALSEIITRPTPYLREDRKGVLGPMMQAILAKTYSAPKQHWSQLFDLLWKSIEQRHLQMYFLDESAQQAAEAINAAGRMIPPEKGDFLAIINANLGGAKSNLFTTSEVKQMIDLPQNGTLKKTVEITYKNSRQADNCNLEAGKLCLNATLQDWTRLYLPAGAKLIEAQGFSTEPKEYEEAGFSVIDGFFSLEPLSVAKLKITYTIPYEDQQNYRITLWKQGGIDPVPHLLDVNGNQEEIKVDKDITFETPF